MVSHVPVFLTPLSFVVTLHGGPADTAFTPIRHDPKF